MLELDQVVELGGVEVAKVALSGDLAELVARAFFDHVGDHEILAVRGELGERADDAEIGIALRQVESAQLLLVGGQAIGIITVVRLEEAKRTTRLLGVHLLLELAGSEMLGADDIDRADLGLVALVDFEHQVDAVLVELDNLGFDRRGEAALPLVELDNPIDVGANFGASEDLARRELDFGRDLVRLQSLVALEHDAVDDRIFAHGDDEVASIGPSDDDVGE